MNSENLFRQFIRESLSKELVELAGGEVVEYGSEKHIDELNRMINELRSLKDSMKRGPQRKELRKEMSRLQGAIESIRFLRAKAERKGKASGLLKT
jgi:hypothetical protein|tara:strand:+ start:324 stop:611 length:288 start_codon:yes stop_codon:yes gene_type:complete